MNPDIKDVNNEIIIVNVRWQDSYLEQFQCDEVRFGSDLLWMRLSSGQNRHIPLRPVRWFSVDPESHEKVLNYTNPAWPVLPDGKSWNVDNHEQ